MKNNDQQLKRENYKYLVYREKDILSDRIWTLYNKVYSYDNEFLSDLQNLNELLKEFIPLRYKNNHFELNKFIESPLAVNIIPPEDFNKHLEKDEKIPLEKTPREIYNFIFSSFGVDEQNLTGDFRKDRKNSIKNNFIDVRRKLYMYGFQNEDNVISDEILFAKHTKDQRCVFPIECGIVSSNGYPGAIPPRSLDSFGNN